MLKKTHEKPLYVCPDVPSLEAYRQTRKDLSEAIHDAATALGFHDPAAFGQKLAEAMDPPRDYAPFSAAIVQDWFDGKLVPDSATMQTLDELLGEDFPAISERLESYETASVKPLEVQKLFVQSVFHAIKQQPNAPKTLKELSKTLQGHCPELSAATAYTMLRGVKKLNQNCINALKDSLESFGFSPYEQNRIGATLEALLALESGQDKIICRTELSQTMSHLRDMVPMNNTEFARALAQHGFGTPQPDGTLKPCNSDSLAAYLSGEAESVPYGMIQALKSLCASYDTRHLTPLSLLYEARLREAADIAWNHAEETGKWGDMLHACRLRMGINSMQEMSELIAQRLGRSRPFDIVTIMDWESGTHLPTSEKGARNVGLVSYVYTELMEEWEQKPPSMLAQQAGAEPWFDESRKHAFESAIKKAVVTSNTCRNSGNILHFEPHPSTPSSHIFTNTLSLSSLPTHASAEGYQQSKRHWAIRQPLPIDTSISR